MHDDRFVDAHDGIRIAVRDHGGGGPDLVLLHGAGSHLLSLFNLVRKLTDDVRIVSVDARWSGQSGDSEVYDWGDLVGDVESVVDQLDLANPVVGGHSWGGMIAAHYGAAHPEAPAVINIDGQGAGDASLYDGLTADDVDHTRAMLEAANAPGTDLGHEGDDAWLALARAENRSFSELLGVPTDLLDEWTDRNFVEVAPGRWRRHPSPVLFTGLQGDLDLFTLYRRVECPLQIFNCTGPEPDVPPEFGPFMAAYRRGLTRAFRTLADERPKTSVRHGGGVDIVTLPDMSHNGVLARGATVAAVEIRRFLASAGVV